MTTTPRRPTPAGASLDADGNRPQFAVVVRGYDRHQVDDYVTRLLEYLSEAEQRTRTAEQPTGASARTLPQPPMPPAPEVAATLPLDDAQTQKPVLPAGRSPAERSSPVVGSGVLLLLSLASALLLVYVVLT